MLRGGHRRRAATWSCGWGRCSGPQMRSIIIPVSERNTPPEKKTLGSVGLKHAESRGGEQLLMLFCKAKARIKGVCLFVCLLCLFLPGVSSTIDGLCQTSMDTGSFFSQTPASYIIIIIIMIIIAISIISIMLLLWLLWLLFVVSLLLSLLLLSSLLLLPVSYVIDGALSLEMKSL